MPRKLTVKRETLTAIDRTDLQQIVAASISCPIVALRDKVMKVTEALVATPETNVITLCHCP